MIFTLKSQDQAEEAMKKKQFVTPKRNESFDTHCQATPDFSNQPIFQRQYSKDSNESAERDRKSREIYVLSERSFEESACES